MSTAMMPIAANRPSTKRRMAIRSPGSRGQWAAILAPGAALREAFKIAAGMLHKG